MKTTTVTVTYYDPGGTSYSGGSAIIEPNARQEFKPGSSLGSNYFAAKISSDNSQPLAVIVIEGGGSITALESPAAYNGVTQGATTLYARLIKKNYIGSTTGITLQNISSSQASFTAYYYDMNGAQWGSPVVRSITPNAPYALYNPPEIENGFLGSVRIVNTNGTFLAGQMNEADGGALRLMSNLMFSGTTTVHIPVWYDNYNGGGGDWVSGVNVRNVGSGSNLITATWYTQSGQVALTQSATLTNSHDTHNFYDLPTTGSGHASFIGSLVITAQQPIVAVSNARNWNGTAGKDSVMAINGSNR